MFAQRFGLVILNALEPGFVALSHGLEEAALQREPVAEEAADVTEVRARDNERRFRIFLNQAA